MEREEPERQQTNTTTAEAYLDALWTYILGLVRAGVEEPQDRPNAPETDESQTYDYVQIPSDVTMSITQSERFTTSLPRDRALAILAEIDEAEKLTRQRALCLSSASMAICWYHVENEHMALFWEYRDRNDSRCEPKQTWMA